MNTGKLVVTIAASVFLTGCATSNPFSNIPVEDRSSGREAASIQAPVREPVSPSGVVVTPIDPGTGIRPIAEQPIIRAQREILPPADEVWQSSIPVVTSSQQSPIGQPVAVENAAVIALLDSAKQESTQGDLRAAQTRLERAQRIGPREPEVYFQLADVKRQLGQFMDAEQVALRGVDVAEGQSLQLRRLWALISQIRTEAGDLAGANDARVEASRH